MVYLNKIQSKISPDIKGALTRKPSACNITHFRYFFNVKSGSVRMGSTKSSFGKLFFYQAPLKDPRNARMCLDERPDFNDTRTGCSLMEYQTTVRFCVAYGDSCRLHS